MTKNVPNISVEPPLGSGQADLDVRLIDGPLSEGRSAEVGNFTGCHSHPELGEMLPLFTVNGSKGKNIDVYKSCIEGA